MNIQQVEEGTKCNWCEEEAHPNEDMLVQDGLDVNGLSYYHLRCAGKLFVLRIEGILPAKVFRAVVHELNTNLVLQDEEE